LAGQAEESGVRRTGYSAPALEKGLDVVELLATARGGLTISEIATALHLSISQIFRMIVVMERRGWLFRDQGDRYRVTYKVLDVAFRATPAQELAHVATPIMYALSHETNQACHLVVRQTNSALVVVRQESPGTIGFSLRPGTVVNLFSSSSGHVLLAFAGSEIAEQVLATAPPSVERKKVSERLQLVREQGFESQDSARVRGVRDVSYPIFGFDGAVAAALTIPYVTFIDGTPGVSLEDAREMLRKASIAVSEGMGQQSETAPAT
jgi:DNA-binding IclR family transcriptional regulator